MEPQDYQLFFSQDSTWTEEEKAKIQETIIRVFAEYKYSIQYTPRNKKEGIDSVDVYIIDNLMEIRVPEVFERDNYWGEFMKAHEEAAKRGIMIDPAYRPIKFEYITGLFSLDSLDYDIRNLIEAVSGYTRILRKHKTFIDTNFKIAQIAHTYLFMLLNLQKDMYVEYGKFLYLDNPEDDKCILTIPFAFSMERHGEEAQAFMKDIHNYLKQIERKPYYQPFMLSYIPIKEDYPEQFKYLEGDGLPF